MMWLLFRLGDSEGVVELDLTSGSFNISPQDLSFEVLDQIVILDTADFLMRTKPLKVLVAGEDIGSGEDILGIVRSSTRAPARSNIDRREH